MAVDQQVKQMMEELGCVGVVVDAKSGAEEFYRRYGFEPSEGVEP